MKQNDIEIFKDLPNVKFAFPLREITSFRTGGAAAVLAEPADAEGVAEVLRRVKTGGVPLAVLGAGTNAVVSDKGFDGVVLRIGCGMSAVKFEGETLYAEAGAPLARLSAESARRGLAGLEFACGIPGSAGGAVYMNAGAYDSDTAGAVSSVTALLGGRLVNFPKEACGFCYRESVFQETDCVIIGVTFSLKKGVKEEIAARREEYRARRALTNPKGLPNAGSAFKRPKNDFAARLIEEAGLKGLTEGGARVWEGHAGFIVNSGGAMSADIYKLTQKIREEVFKFSGIMLESEYKFIGEF